MCGIAGYFNPGGHPGDIKPILDLISHRGPDFQHIHTEESIALGHTRLSILDLSDRGNQPMKDLKTGNIIVFNGEIYNFKSLREELIGKGHTFNSSGDTEVLLKLYGEYGEKCISMLRGMFAFAIWDNSKKQLFIARDRLGKKPFFYSQSGNSFIFASEIRALAAHPDISKDVDVQAIDLFMSTGCVPSPFSIYSDIRKLPAAHYGIVNAQGLSLHRYWSLDFTQKIECSEEDVLESLHSRLLEATRIRLESDVPLGALLSGGVDSSLVVALMAEAGSKSIDTFTIGFHEKKYDESGHAAKVAKHLGVNHHVEYLDPTQFENMLPAVVRQYGEPFSDDAALATMLLSEATRKHVTVALSGDGGDELACGYSAYTHVKLASALAPMIGKKILPEKNIASAFNSNSALGKLRRKMICKFHPEFKRILRNEFKVARYKNDVFRADVQEQLGQFNFKWQYELSRQACIHAKTPAERLLWMDTVHFLADALLVKVDIASMAHSLEVRSPLLDHELFEYMASLPPELKIKGGESKYLLKKLAERYLPKDILYRRKQGFSMPVAKWTSGDSADFTLDAISQAKPFLLQFFDMNALNKRIDEHISGRKKHKNFVWNILNLALWAIEHKNGRV
ncbi:asparagine synthase (glutamine-hydrolyzing) [Maridesulfovibrio salexigens]|uniref:asparagine synthase (glutamine-hydrolyzing) n=1 Tax=Maridesulfovibrio salexigens (strain ATCC 14822 / DSM 2638 / NCIMB 8403 / VKM B-1763) TaxID=526222 RepID=C6C0L2_MARSD|nr:asparagine synthase (glutamine-hydrolyzing) [Maridesulfovibrio salexigens]ACS79146.1 asparagine synthase (glutamine-hydrolyzing) [Maridesulfovibrio salexigens DSM 2638]